MAERAGTLELVSLDGPRLADAPADPQAAGHYFDQAIFDLHYLLLSARAERLAAHGEFEDLPFSVDRLGNVTLRLRR